MKHVILGGGGFIGSHLTDRLLNDNHEVIIIDRPNLAHYRKFNPNEQVRWLECDALNPGEWLNEAENADVVYHLLSTTLPHTSNNNPCYDVQSNLISTLKILEALASKRCGRIIFVSSGGTVYGNPTQIPIHENTPLEPLCSYGIVKLAIEKYLEIYRRQKGLDYRVLRVSNPYGERQMPSKGQGAVAVFLNKARNNETIEIWGDGSAVRDYLYVGDVADALCLAAQQAETANRVFNVGSGRGLSLNALLSELEQLLGRHVTRQYLPARRFDTSISVLDIDRARSELAWQPAVPLAEGLRRTLAWQIGNDSQQSQ